MKNNNFQPTQNPQNLLLNKNPYRIQNFNYMFYLLPGNPNLYNIPNMPNPLLPLRYIPNFPQNQFQLVPDIRLINPLLNNLNFNNLLQLSLLNLRQNLPQNQNILPNININNTIPDNQFPQNTIQNNIFLNKKTSNPEDQDTEKENPYEIKPEENNDNNINNKNNFIEMIPQ